MSSAYFSTVTTDFDLNAGRSVTGLDVNGDGIGDLIIGAETAVNGASFETTGQVIVIYGSAAASDFATSTFDLDDTGLTDGSDGFYISGAAFGSELGWDVLNAGDQNSGDGKGADDLAIVSRADGTITVVFGDPATDPTDIDLSAGIGGAGYTITGLPILADDVTVSGGTDVNDDSVADLVISASNGSGTDSVYVVFGDATGDDVDLTTLDGTDGFEVTGLELINTGSFNTGAVGDLDNDGTDDILLGLDVDGVGATTGDIVVMLGTSTVQPATFDIDDLGATEALTLTGLSADVASTASVSGGFDINGDGIDDIAIGVSGDDSAGVNAGAVYVVFGESGLDGSVDLTALDGTDGFKIEGLAAGDELGIIVQSLGDVSGDEREDLGIMTAAGDLYVIYGIDGAASFGATVDLSTLNGANGYAISGLFDTAPSSLSLSGLPSINSDDINDIAIGATFDGGLTAGETVVIFGGAQNFQNLDDADNTSDDGSIAFDEIDEEVEFSPTDTSIIIGGDATGDIDEDGTTTTGAISIVDSNGGSPTFANKVGTGGVYGGLVVNAAGNQWTYTLNNTEEDVQALNVGETIVEIFEVAADGAAAAQTITITINGSDDDAVFNGDLAPDFSEDISQFTSSFTLTDVDDDDPSLAGLRFDGTFGFIEFNDAGDAYTYFQTSPGLQDLGDTETDTETITVTDSAGNDFDIVVTFTGLDEGTPLDFDNTDNDIFTSFGDDIIQALGGDDNINPGGGDDNVDAGEGNDTVLDGMGNDTVDGGADNDKITLLTGENIVDGGTGSDFIQTGFKSDDIMGGEGNDIISADSNALFLFGNDRVEGGAGDDLMSAGAGADTFVFNINDGVDTIATFNEANVAFDSVTGFSATPVGVEFESGIDKIELNGFTTVNATNIFDAITDTGNGAQFSAEGTTITFFNLTEAQLSVDDFIFV